MLIKLALLHIGFFTMKVCRLDLGSSQTRFVQVVVNLEIGILKTQALFQSSAVSVGLDTHRCYPELKQRIPNREAIREREVELPALLANVANAEGPNLDTADCDFLSRCEWKRLVGDAFRVIH